MYSSNQAGPRDTAGGGIKFSTPTIANGHVYLGTQTEVDVYGLLPQASGVSPSAGTPSGKAPTALPNMVISPSDGEDGLMSLPGLKNKNSGNHSRI